MALLQSRLAAIAPSVKRARNFSLVNILAFAAIVVMAVASLGDIVRHPDAALVKSDFAAFYCGAVVTANLHDPYALGPIRACEAQRVDIPGGAQPSVVGVDPDPLPGYNMAVFMPFTLMPFREAALLWDLILVAAIVGTCILLAQLTRLPILVIGAVLVYLDGVASIPYGQTAPLVTFGLTLAAFGLVRERLGLIISGAALSMLVPQIGIPACVAIFVWRPALRPAILAVGTVLAGVSLLVLGVPLNLEYVKNELPAHALAEAMTSTQYSLTWLLHFLGLGDQAAIRIASIQYAIFALGGVALAGKLEKKLQSAAAIVLFPPAVALIGGSFIHIQQMAAALPFALLVASRSRSAFVWPAIALLILPWPAESAAVTLGSIAIIAVLALEAMPNRPTGTALGIACAAAILYGAVAGPLMKHVIPAVPQRIVAAAAPMPRALDGEPLASEEDAREVRLDTGFALATPRTLATRLPIWISLSALVLLGLMIKPTGRRSQKFAA